MGNQKSRRDVAATATLRHSTGKPSTPKSGDSKAVASKSGADLSQSADRQPLAIAAIWVGLLALGVFLPGAFNRWFLPKELAFLCAVLIASFVPAAGRVRRPVWALIAAGGALLLVSALLSDQPLAAVFGRWPRYEGLVSLPVYAVAVWFGARLLGPDAGSVRRQHWYRAASVLAIAIACFALLEAWDMSPIASDLERSGSLLGNASDQGIVCAALAALLLPQLMQGVPLLGSPESKWAVAGVGASVLGVVLSASRGGLLALTIGMVVSVLLAALALRRSSHAWRAVKMRSFVASASVLGLAALLTIFVPMARDRALGLSPLAAATVGDRALIWGEAAAILSGSPLVGVGPSGFADSAMRQHGSEWFATVAPGTVLDSPHSWPLQAAMAGGWLLLLLALVLLVVVVVIGVSTVIGSKPEPATGGAIDRSNKDRELGYRTLVAGSLGALAALAGGLATHFTAPATGILAGVLIGICCARPLGRAVGRRLGALVSGVIAAWLVLFAVTVAAEFPLNAGVRASSAGEADAAFASALALRPWDGDIASIAAQTFAARADAGATGAGEFGVRWAAVALDRIPNHLPSQVALGVSQRAVGEFERSEATLRGVYEAQPRDPQIQVQFAITLAQNGKFEEATELIELAEASTPQTANLIEIARWIERLRGA